MVFTGTLLRFLYLDSDPHYYEWIGYITDEGRWVQHARNLALHGTLVDSSGMNFHLFMAPLFELSNYLVFELLGVSIFASRLFTALCGSAILALFWGCLRRAVTPQALLVGVALLALQSDLIGLSRVAVPEMVVMSFELAVYFLIVLGTSPWHMVSAGVLLLMACGMKATAALLLPIFSVIIFCHASKSHGCTKMVRFKSIPDGVLGDWIDRRRNRLFFAFGSDPNLLINIGELQLLSKASWEFRSFIYII